MIEVILSFFVGFCFLFLIKVLFLGFSDSKENIERKSVNLDVPNPEKAPIEFLHFLETSKSEYMAEIYLELCKKGALSNSILKEAFEERISSGKIDFDKWRKKILAAENHPETTYSNASKKESVEKPKFDYSRVEFVQDIKPNLKKLKSQEVFKKIDRKFLYPKKDVSSIHETSIFYRKKVVITGMFSQFENRNEVAEVLYELGADVDTSVSGRTNYLIVGEDAGISKIDKASELGIQIISEEEFVEILKNSLFV